MEEPEVDELVESATAHACEAVRQAGNEHPLRGIPIGEPSEEWSPGHLRTIHEQRVGVYEQLGRMQIVMDRRGRVLEIDDGRHKPSQKGVYASTLEAMERVARICGLPAEDPRLRAELEYDGEHHYFYISTIPPAATFYPDGTFERPAYTFVEAYVNATTGGIWRLQHKPLPRERPPEEPEEPEEAGEVEPRGQGGEPEEGEAQA